MARIAILYCKRIKDHSCIACAKCFKGISERNGAFAQHDQIDLVAMTDCGDCPGLIIPRVKFLTDAMRDFDRPIETIHLGTCMKSAMDTAGCPIDFDEVKVLVEQKFNAKLVLGTHTY